MNTLRYQRQRLENGIIASKERIRAIRESEFLDLKTLHQLNETIERNLQLICMIDHHLTDDRRSISRSN